MLKEENSLGAWPDSFFPFLSTEYSASKPMRGQQGLVRVGACLCAVASVVAESGEATLETESLIFGGMGPSLKFHRRLIGGRIAWRAESLEISFSLAWEAPVLSA